jgi:hypothetical protein
MLILKPERQWVLWFWFRNGACENGCSNFLGFGKPAYIAIERSGSHPNRIRDRPPLAQTGRSKHRLRPVRDMLRDRNDLKVLTGCADFIPNSLADQKACHWGYEGRK